VSVSEPGEHQRLEERQRLGDRRRLGEHQHLGERQRQRLEERLGERQQPWGVSSQARNGTGAKWHRHRKFVAKPVLRQAPTMGALK
jgi:hypothetical protein